MRLATRALLLLSLHSSVVHSWVQPHLTGTTAASFLRSKRTNTLLAAEESSSQGLDQNLAGKSIYQRVFYRFSPGSDVDVHDAVVVEERVRFEQNPDDPEYLTPVGPRTLILRDGQVEDGEIGEDFFTCEVHDGKETHQGAGEDLMIQSSIATALYLASNPTLISGRVLEVACDLGLAGILGCCGAGYVSGNHHVKKDISDDIMTIPDEQDGLLPSDLKALCLSDSDEDRLNLAFKNVKTSGLSPSVVNLEEIQWDKRIRHVPGKFPQEFNTIVASDVAFSYPEAKELAHTVANRLLPLGATAGLYMGAEGSGPPPRFVHVCPEAREDPIHLHRFFEKGYKMTVDTGYLKMERLTFHFQTLPQSEHDMSKLDDLDLELQEYKELPYQSLTAQHSPDYAGEGSGELFFPMMTGEYDASSGSTFLERDPSSRPW